MALRDKLHEKPQIKPLEEAENFNVPKSTLSEFLNDVKRSLAFLTGLTPYEVCGLTLEDVRKPILVTGKPGIGKTCGVISCVKEMNEKLPAERKLGFKKILLGQTVVGSLQGIPIVKPDGTVMRVQMPDLPNPEIDGEYGVLFLDEITTADEMQVQPALGLCDDSRSLGEYRLPEHWIVIAAGNGPDCTNFVRFDDMTLTRFAAYDIQYNYKEDFRPYAHASGISEDIIAYLNFSPDACVRVESTDMDHAGKMFPCPRTWERLSVELKMREMPGGGLSDSDDIGRVAGRIVGTRAGREFGAFLAYKKLLNYDPEKILAGEERAPEVGMPKEMYHIIMEGLFKLVKERLKDYNTATDSPKEMYPMVANLVRWILQFHELENKVNAMFEIKNEIPAIAKVMQAKDFGKQHCPELDEFIGQYSRLILTEVSGLETLRF